MPDSAVSLSTVQSTLERLHRKEVLVRRKQARAFLYAPKLQRGELISLLLRDIADDIAGGDVASMVSGFVAFLGDDRSRVATLLDGGDPGVPERRESDQPRPPSPRGPEKQ